MTLTEAENKIAPILYKHGFHISISAGDAHPDIEVYISYKGLGMISCINWDAWKHKTTGGKYQDLLCIVKQTTKAVYNAKTGKSV